MPILRSLFGLIRRMGDFSYIIIFLVTFFESAAFTGFVLPGETFVIFVGFLAARRYLSLKYTLIAVGAGALLGDNTGYFIGKQLGRKYFEEHNRFLLLHREHIDIVDGYFNRHGGITVIIGRFISFIRSVTPFSAGLGRMRYPRFFAYNLAGVIGWTFSFTLLGYFFGRNLNLIETWLGRAGLIVFILLAIGFLWIFRYFRKRPEETRRQK